jgi:hypothetical protein
MVRGPAGLLRTGTSLGRSSLSCPFLGSDPDRDEFLDQPSVGCEDPPSGYGMNCSSIATMRSSSTVIQNGEYRSKRPSYE